MKEEFLHYVWKSKNIDFLNLKTTEGQKLEILNFGTYTQRQGPDFFNALLKIDDQLWAGNVEMHVKSSDWYIHNHEIDNNYNNVILHVVWEHDVEVFNKENQTLPTLVLKPYVNAVLLIDYQKLISSSTLINCANEIHTVPQHIIVNWKERLFLDRLEYKIQPIENFKNQTNSNWSLITYIVLAKAFGLNTNGEIFKQMIFSLPENLLFKIQNNLISLEAVFLGVLNLLPQDPLTEYEQMLCSEYIFLKNKFKLDNICYKPEFFKHRPDNFPTIRLMQLAQLIHLNSNLFQKIVEVTSVSEFNKLLKVSCSEFWNTHYTFTKESKFKIKSTSNDFINLVLINAIIPLLYVYNKSIYKDNIDQLIDFMEYLPLENNNATNIFNKLQFPMQSAFDSQAVLHLKKNYCDLNLCLNCCIGNYILKQ